MAKQQSADPLKLVLSTHRLSFVHLDMPYAFKDDKGEDGKAKYSVTFLIPKTHPDVAKIQNCMLRAYNDNKAAMFPGLPFTSPKILNPLRDGDAYADEKIGEGAKEEQVAAYRGCYYLKASSGGDKPAPMVFEQDAATGIRQEVIDVKNDVYSGCYGRGVLKCSAYNNVSKGISFFINSVCKIKDGPRLGGFTASEADYEEDEDYSDVDALDGTETYSAPVVSRAAAPRPNAPAPRDPYTYDQTEDGTPIRSLNGIDWEYYDDIPF